MLYEDPDLYDALFQPDAHAALYGALARQHPGPVLELACGTGQLTAPLASSGRRVIGLDLSASMLAAARQRAEAAGADVEFREGDMRAFEMDERFGLVFVARNSLLHLHAADDLIATFQAARRQLRPGGVFAFDVFNPDVRLLARPAGERHPVMRARSDAYGELTVESTNDYDAAAQVNRATWYISTPEQADRWVAPLHLRSLFPQELPLLLAAAGLRLRHRAGDLRGGAFTGTSARQVCVCEAIAPA